MCVQSGAMSLVHTMSRLEKSLFSLRSIQASYFLRTRSTVMSDVSIRAPRQNTHLPRRLHVIRDGELANPPSLLSACVEGSRSSVSPSLWLKWDIERVCAAHWEAHYNALACCWKWPWPGALIQNVLNEGPPVLMCQRSQWDLERMMSRRNRSWHNISLSALIWKLWW